MTKNELWIQVGEKLKELRKQKGLSVHKTGRQLGVSGNYISEIERGKKSPSEALIIALAEFYGLERGYLFEMYGKEESGKVREIAALPESVRKTINQMSIDKNLTQEDIDEAIKALQRIADRIKDER